MSVKFAADALSPIMTRDGAKRVLGRTSALATTALCSVLAITGVTRVANAQSTVSGQTSSSQGSGSELEEITVSARRREESVQKVPISINALSEEDLAQANVKGIADIAAITPGLQFMQPNGFGATINTISIRGMNTQVGASVVGIYLDDTPVQTRLPAIGNVGNPYPVVFDLNRVEVERGPQGTLFGAGSEAGAVRFISNSPSLTEYSGFTHAEFATTQGGAPSEEIGAAGGGPIIEDKLGFRLSVWDRHDGGYVDRIDPITGATVDRDANADEKLALKAALALQVSEGVLITPSIFYQAINTDDSGRFYGIFSDASDGVFNNGRLLPEESTDHLSVSSIKLEAHLPFADLTGVASYMNDAVDLTSDLGLFYGPLLGGFGSPVGPWMPVSESDVIPLVSGRTVRAFTEEVRLASNEPTAFFTWVAGIFVDHRTQVDWQSEFYAPEDATGPFYSIREQVTDEQLAAFGQGDFHLTSKWTVTLGERFGQVKTNESDINGTGPFNAGEPPIAYTNIKQTPSTPKASLSYQADPNNLFYASVGKGFRVGGGNAPLPNFCNETVPPYESDYVWSYEVGAKEQFFERRLQINSSLFRVNWSNIQQIVTPPCGVSYTGNAGTAVTKGFDLALQALVTDQLQVKLDVGYVNAYFTSSVNDSLGQPLVLSGDKIGLLPQVNPPWDVNTSANYEIPLPQGDKIHLRGEYEYHSRNPGPFVTQNPTSPNYFPLITADPPTHLFNARLGYTQGKRDVTLFAQNVFNSRPMLGAFQYPATSNLVTYQTFRPRTVGLSFNWGF
jgi:iron complex outermembrane recepter protein